MSQIDERIGTKLMKQLVDSAKETYDDYPVMQRVVVTQAIHESHLNSSAGISLLARDYKNLFGIKGKGPSGKFVELPTWEYVDGHSIKVMADFAVYDSYTACFESHRALMEHPRYKRVLDSQDPSTAFRQLLNCGYATNPEYAAILIDTYDKYVAQHFEAL